MGSKVNLKKYLKVDGKWRFYPVLKVDGKPRPEAVMIDGEAKKGTNGSFYIEWRENGKRRQVPCGTTPREAKEAWQTRTAELNGTIEREQDDTAPLPLDNLSIKSACDTFLDQIKATKSLGTWVAYSGDLVWFQKHLRRSFVGKVTRTDLLHLFGVGREQRRGQSTINRAILVGLMALRETGAKIEMKKGDWPPVLETEIVTYTPEEIVAFFAACDEREWLIFQTYLQSGFRNRELATLRSRDIDPRQCTLTVCKKLELEFSPKNHEVRKVRVPAALITMLVERAKKNDGALLFPTLPHPKRRNYGGDSEDAHHLELCKRIAHRAGLNCGLCVTAKGKCSNGPHCEHWFLHKWRHTYATNQLRSGMDLKTLQKFLGHKQLSTTEKYLEALHLDQVAGKIESSLLAAFLSPPSA